MSEIKKQAELEECITEPCKTLDYCPYGCLVEYFPLHGKLAQWNSISLRWIRKPLPRAKACKKFGHDCPAYYVAEIL